VTGATISFPETSVTLDLTDGEVTIDLILLCKDCGGKVGTFGGVLYDSDRVYRDVYVVCRDCGKKGKIREDRMEKIVSIYKKVQLVPPEEFKK